jgi:hypothetical protein
LRSWSVYVFPSIGGDTQALHPLLAWWAVLFALSLLARYQPDNPLTRSAFLQIPNPGISGQEKFWTSGGACNAALSPANYQGQAARTLVVQETRPGRDSCAPLPGSTR